MQVEKIVGKNDWKMLYNHHVIFDNEKPSGIKDSRITISSKEGCTMFRHSYDRFSRMRIDEVQGESRVRENLVHGSICGVRET